MTRGATTAGRRARVAGIAFLLVFAVVSVYGQTLGHEFVNYDDPVFFLENPALELGLSADGVRWALTSQRAANWFPITRLSFLADAELHGTSSTGVHLTNLLLHACSTLFLFFALLRMTGRLGASAFVAGVFALHPLQVESVAWASERKGLLAGCFWLATVFVYAGTGREALTLRRWLLVFLLLACGLASKLVLATLPGVLLLLDYWPLGRLGTVDGTGGVDGAKLRRALLEKVPLGLAVLVALALVYQAQSGGGAVASFEQVPWGLRVGNAAIAYARYVGLFFWPTDLAVFHPHAGASLSVWQAVLAGSGLAAVTAWALAGARRRPALAVGWLWYLGTLVPMIGLVHLGSQSFAERYFYVPGIGLALALAWTVSDRVAQLPRARAALPALAVCVLLALGIASHRQVATWRTSETLFRHAIRVTERNPVAHRQLGYALLRAGRDAEAIEQYRQGVAANPRDSLALNNLAWVLATHPDPALRDPEEAVELGGKAVRTTGGADPSSLDTLAAAYAAAGHSDLAVLTAGKALRIAGRTKPALVPAITERLALYRAGGRYEEAPRVPGHPFDAPESLRSPE